MCSSCPPNRSGFRPCRGPRPLCQTPRCSSSGSRSRRSCRRSCCPCCRRPLSPAAPRRRRRSSCQRCRPGCLTCTAPHRRCPGPRCNRSGSTPRRSCRHSCCPCCRRSRLSAAPGRCRRPRFRPSRSVSRPCRPPRPWCLPPRCSRSAWRRPRSTHLPQGRRRPRRRGCPWARPPPAHRARGRSPPPYLSNCLWSPGRRCPRPRWRPVGSQQDRHHTHPRPAQGPRPPATGSWSAARHRLISSHRLLGSVCSMVSIPHPTALCGSPGRW